MNRKQGKEIGVVWRGRGGGCVKEDDACEQKAREGNWCCMEGDGGGGGGAV